MDFLLFHVLLLPGTNILRWEWEGLQANFAYFLHFLTMCAVCFIVFIKFFVSCQALAEALQQNSSLTDLDLRENNIGPEGTKAWCLVKMVSWGERVWRKAKEGSRYSCLKVRSGKWWKAMQCSIGSQCQIWESIESSWRSLWRYSVSSLIFITVLIVEYNLEMFLGGTQTPKVQKLGVQKRSVFSPVGDSRWWCWRIWQAKTAVKTFCNCTVRVSCVLHRVSQIVCLLPGSGRGLATELQSDEPGFVRQQHRPRRGEGLVFGEDGVMRGEGVKKGKGRVKAQLFESQVREMMKGNAVQRWFSDVPRLRSHSIGEHLSMTGVWRAIADFATQKTD